MDLIALMQLTDRVLDAVAPLLLRCALLLASLYYLLGGSVILGPLQALARRLQSPQGLNEHPIAKEFGLKLVPASLLLGTLLALVILDRIVISIGDTLPGRITLQQPQLLISAVRPERLAELWSLNATAKNLFDLHQWIDYQVANLAPPANPNVAMPWLRHSAAAAATAKAFEAMKCFVLIWLLVSVNQRRLGLPGARTWRRFGVLLTLACVLAALAVHSHQRERGQVERAKVAYLLAARLSSDPKAAEILADSAKQADYRQRIAAFNAQTPGKAAALNW